MITSTWASTSDIVTICVRKAAAPQNSSPMHSALRSTTRPTRLQRIARTEQRLDRTATSTCSLTTHHDNRGEMKVGDRVIVLCVRERLTSSFWLKDYHWYNCSFKAVNVNKMCVSLGLVTGEDYEEVRLNRGGRGGRLQGGQKSWRYSR